MRLFESSLECGLLVVLLLAWIAFTAFLRSQRERWFMLDPLNFFWLGFIWVYVLQALAWGPTIIAWNGEDSFFRASLWTFVSAVVLFIGFESRFGRRLGRMLPGTPQVIDPSKMRALGWTLVVVGLASYFYLISTAESILAWFSGRSGGTDWGSANTLLSLQKLSLFSGLIVLLIDVNTRRSSTLRKACIYGMVSGFGGVFIFLGDRGDSVFIILTLLMCTYIPKRKNPSTAVLAAVLLGALVIVQFLALYRDPFRETLLGTSSLEFDTAYQGTLNALVGLDELGEPVAPSRGLELNCSVTVFALVPEVVDYNYGFSLLELFARWIPRKIWQNKRYPYQESFTPIMELGELSTNWVWQGAEPILTGPTFTFVGSWYAVGGPLALVLAAFGTGCVLRAIRMIYDRSPGSDGDTILYVILLPFIPKEVVMTPLFSIFDLPFMIGGVVLFFYLGKPDDAKGKRP